MRSAYAPVGTTASLLSAGSGHPFADRSLEMESRRFLKIARGVREVAKARGNGNPSSEIPAATNRFSNSNRPCKVRSRVMGHVGVAVRRDGISRPAQTYDSLFGERDEDSNGDNNDDDTEGAYEPSSDEIRGPRPSGSRPANTFLPSPSNSEPPPDQADDDTTIDLTEDYPAPAPSTPAGFFDCDDPSAAREGRPCPTVGRHSLASWLVPVPSPEVGKGKKRRRQQRQQPLREADGSQDPYSSGGSGAKGRTWAAFSQESGESSRPDGSRGIGGDGPLSAWLEPPPSPASRKIRIRQKGFARSDSAAAGYGPSGFLGYEDDERSGDENDSGKWMSDRLEGLDPSGAARAKDSWTDRERRNLTCTDIALGAKRKNRGGRSRGWKTKAGGSKVFVETQGGVVASGRAAYRKSKRGGGGGGGVRKKRRG